MKKGIIFCMALGATLSIHAQGGPKWALNGNGITGLDFLGTTNLQPLIFKTNGLEHFRINAIGEIVFTDFSGSGNGMFTFDNSGKLSKIVFTGNSTDVLLGNGTFGDIGTTTGWVQGSTYMYTTKNIGIGGVLTPTNALEVLGNTVISGSISTSEMNVGTVAYVRNQLKFQSSLCIDAFDPSIAGSRNEICGLSGDLFISSKPTLNHNTILNYSNAGNVGIGTDHPNEKLHVDGNIRSNADVIATRFAFGTGGAKMDYLPATATEPAYLRAGLTLGSGSFGIPPSCNFPNVTLVNQVNGMFQSWDYSVFGGTANALNFGFDGANGRIEMEGTSTEPSASRLLINYGCGKDVFICTGDNGGNVFLLNEDNEGVVGIGTAFVPSGYRFAVAGKMYVEEIKVKPRSAWPDYVFSAEYKRMTYEEKEKYIQLNHHLPGFESATTIEKDGLTVGETMNAITQNVEENTLDIIELYKLVVVMKKEIQILKEENIELKKLIEVQE